MKKWMFLPSVLLCVFLFGCVTHYVVDGSVRLQLGNATENCTLESLSVVSSNGKELKWIDETILPGESSKVEERDLVGNFRIRLVYEKDGELKDTVFTRHFDGGSTFLQISEKDDVLVIRKK